MVEGLWNLKFTVGKKDLIDLMDDLLRYCRHFKETKKICDSTTDIYSKDTKDMFNITAPSDLGKIFNKSGNKLMAMKGESGVLDDG